VNVSRKLSSQISTRLLSWMGICGLIFVIYQDEAGAAPTKFEENRSPLQLQTFKTHSRIRVPIDEAVSVEWKNLAKGFRLLLKGVSLFDLGGPMGELSDSRVKNIQIKENQAGVLIAGEWKFPSGTLKLAHPQMEHFEYRDKWPSSSYVVDFWVKAGPTVLELKVNERQARLAALLKKTRDDEKNKVDRRLATEKRRREAENSLRFCSETLSETNDFFLEFSPHHPKIDFSRWFSVTTADVNFSYYRPLKKTREAQLVRVALNFYEKGKTALTLRALDFLQEEFPKSDHRVEMKFLRGNALLKLGLQAEGESVLKELLVEVKDSLVVFHVSLFLAAKQMEKGLTLAALETFLSLIERYPDAKLSWVFHLGVAECLYTLKQAERSAKEYLWVMDHAPDELSKAEATVRIGDLYMQRFQYEQALAAYSRGFEYFKNTTKKFPAFYLNWGEAFYQLRQYDRSAEVMKEFLELYPRYPAGWRASFRLGEIQARKSASSESTAAARDWYYQTINHFPLSAGATLARVRLLPCGDHGGFSLESAERFFSGEAAKFEGDGDVVLKNYQDFRALSRVRTLIHLGSQEDISNAAIGELQNAKAGLLKKILTQVANDFFKKMITGLLDQGKKYEALSAYSANYSLIPQQAKSEKNDVQYILRLSQAASDLGLGKFASELVSAYKTAVESIEDGKDIEDKLLKSEQLFTEAKAMWVSVTESKLEPKSKDLDQIRALLEQVMDESPYTYSKELIMAMIDELQGHVKDALGHVLKANLLKSSVRMDAWLASLEHRIGEDQLALSHYQNIEKNLLLHEGHSKSKNKAKNKSEESVIGIPEVPSLQSLLLCQTEILEGMKKWGDAAATYSRAMDKGLNSGRILYGYAHSLIQVGTPLFHEKAQETLKKLSQTNRKNDDDSFWKKLAVETLASEQTQQSLTNAKEGNHD